MAREAKAETTKVVLTCVYSGTDQSWNPGDVLETDTAEAARLIEVGAAKPYETEAEAG